MAIIAKQTETPSTHEDHVPASHTQQFQDNTPLCVWGGETALFCLLLCLTTVESVSSLQVATFFVQALHSFCLFY